MLERELKLLAWAVYMTALGVFVNSVSGGFAPGHLGGTIFSVVGGALAYASWLSLRKRGG